MSTELKKAEPCYVHTAIAYTNGPPHLGHAYEFVTADIIARYNTIAGRLTYFATGTDEHGQKVETSALAGGKTPKAHCDHWANEFRKIMKSLAVDYDFFVRTTMPEHHKLAALLWELCMANGDIYKGTYDGWYDVRSEAYITESEAQLTDYKDPETGKPYEKKSEETYFFRLSKYEEQIKEWLNKPDSIKPELYRVESLTFVEKGLEDLCISRTTFDWGVKVPNDDKHVMYVWFDALNNYLTNLGFGGCRGEDELEKYEKFWNTDNETRNACVIGKDIVRFHAIIWPAILMSAKIPTKNYHIITHGFVQANDGAKMSKSIGNVIDPANVINQYGVDAVRYYICAAGTYGHDIKFSTDNLIDMNNGVLADVVGNLLNRAANLAKKISDGVIPDVDISSYIKESDIPFDIVKLISNCEAAMKDFHLEQYSDLIAEAARNANKWLAAKEPWKMTDTLKKQEVIRIINEACFVLYLLFSVTCPTAMKAYAEKTWPEELRSKKLLDLNNYYNLPIGTVVGVPGVVFSKYVVKELKLTFEEQKAAKKAKQLEVQKKQREAKLAKEKKKCDEVTNVPDNSPTPP